MAGVKGFEPLVYSLGGCRHILARPHAHIGNTPEWSIWVLSLLVGKALMLVICCSKQPFRIFLSDCFELFIQKIS